MGTEKRDEFSPVAPSELLAEEFLAGYELTQAHYDLELARRALGPETAERIAAQRVA